ncbi:MAG: DUF222 domain-containing protein [Microbacterium sp.]
MFAEPDGIDDSVFESWVSDWDDAVFDPPDAVDRVVEVASMVSVFAAEQLARVAEMRDDAVAEARARGRANTEIIDRSVRLELACALRITEHAAGAMLALAEALVHRYPTVWDRLHRADITQRHAEILVAGVDAVEPERRDVVMRQAIELAADQPVGSFRRALAKLIDTVRVDTLAERHEAAVRRRRVVVEQDHDGMAWVHWYAPAVEARAVFERATSIAKLIRAQDAETRSLDQVRADVIGDLLIDGSTTAHPEQARGIRASVVVTVPVLALLHEEGGAPAGCEPPVVEGVGPIPHATARELCGGSGDWMRVLTHPETGMILSVGRDTYRPPASLARLVKWRADRCMAPGCGVPAARCQIDHNVAWSDGGPTSLANHTPFCQGHHTVKHHGDWTVRQLPDTGGAIEWTSPTGRRYTVRPERRVPVFTPAHDDAEPPF